MVYMHTVFFFNILAYGNHDVHYNGHFEAPHPLPKNKEKKSKSKS